MALFTHVLTVGDQCRLDKHSENVADIVAGAAKSLYSATKHFLHHIEEIFIKINYIKLVLSCDSDPSLRNISDQRECGSDHNERHCGSGGSQSIDRRRGNCLCQSAQL